MKVKKYVYVAATFAKINMSHRTLPMGAVAKPDLELGVGGSLHISAN
jgi:hypothetical protein